MPNKSAPRHGSPPQCYTMYGRTELLVTISTGLAYIGGRRDNKIYVKQLTK